MPEMEHAMGVTNMRTTHLGILLVLTAVMGCGENPGAPAEATVEVETKAENRTENAPESAPARIAPTSPPGKVATNPGTPGTSAPISTGQQRGPRFVLNDPIVDFGDVHDFEKRSVKVSFVNAGDSQLKVSRVQPTCGCTTVKLQKTVFEPGEGEEITLNFSPKGSGQQTKYVKIHTTDPTSPVTNLTIKANVLGTVTANPRTFRIGTIPLGRKHVAYSTITAEDPRYVPTSATITGNLAEHAFLSLKETTQEGASPRTWQLELTVKETAPWGWHSGTANIRGTVKTDSRVYPHNFAMGMNLSAEGMLKSTDTMFRLLILTPGKGFSKRVTLSRTDGKPFNVIGTTVEGGGKGLFDVETVPNGDSNIAWDVILSGIAPNRNQVIKGNVLIQTDVPGEEVISMLYQGNIRSKQ